MKMKSTYAWIGGGIAVVALALAGYGRMEAKEPANFVEMSKAEPLPILRKAPDWTLKDMDGRELKAVDFKGKVVVVDFWATWCPPCRKEIPDYIAMQKKYGERGLVILGFSLDEAPASDVKAFGEKFKINYPLLMASAATAEAFGGVEGLPTAFVIDREGNIRHVKLGMARSAEEYEKLIASLL